MFDEVATSSFAAISIEGAQEEAWKRNVILDVVMTGGDATYEAAVLKKWAGDNAIGVIYGSILTRALTPPDGLARHACVLLNCHDPASMARSAWREAKRVRRYRQSGEPRRASLSWSSCRQRPEPA